MADLYSVIPGLTPSSQELLEAELLCKQILEAKFPDLDLRVGTALRDLVLRPSAMLFALCKKGNEYLFTQNTIKGVDNTTPPDIVDGILSNWFLDRALGTKSVISARIYFASKKNITISSDVYFSPDNVLKFFPLDTVSLPLSALTYEAFSDEWYIDVDLSAEKEGSAYNIGSGSLLYFSNFDPYMLRAEINFLKEASIETETNSQFITRAQNAISTRNLVNVPSIDSNLRQAFNFINKLLPIGMGDTPMIRDQIRALLLEEFPRTPQGISTNGSRVTVQMLNHGYNTGQDVSVKNALPEEFNGEFEIIVIDSQYFTYNLSNPSTSQSITTYPLISAVNYPVLIHNGGMVDIYCSETLAGSIIQLSTDEQGKASLTGPVYEFSRSLVSGGISDDTIPLTLNNSINNVAVSGASITLTLTDIIPSGTFVVGDTITISGINESHPITLSGGSTLANAVLPGHNYVNGDLITITGAVPTQYNGTFSIFSVDASSFSYSVPTQGPVTGGSVFATLNVCNSSFTIASQDSVSNSITCVLPRNPSIVSFSSSQVSSPVKYLTSNYYSVSRNVTSITSSGTTVQVVLPRHGYPAGRYITISGSTISSQNGVFLISRLLGENIFEVYNPASGTSNGTSNQGAVSFTNTWQDYGFSERQKLVVDFGASFANKTFSIETSYFQNLDSIQSYLDSAGTRVLCADYLARGFNFYHLDVSITSYNGPAPSTATVSSIIESYASNLGPGEVFVVSDMVAKLRINGIINIQNPPLITFKKYTRDLHTAIRGSILDVLDPKDETNIFLLNSVQTFSQSLPK